MVLANGIEEQFQFFNVTVMWNGRARDVRAQVSDATPLVGMRLLHRHNLYLEIVEGGRVVIQPQG